MRAVFFIAVLPAVLTAVSCAPQQEQVESSVPPEPVIEVPPPGPPETFTYSENPTLALIPPGPIKGEANGKPIEIKAVVFEPTSNGNWIVQLCEDPFADPTQVLWEGEYVYFELPESPAGNKIIAKPMEFGGGFFQIEKPDEPGEKTSWNAENAWVIEIIDWEAKPWDPEGDVFQTAGTASGRVAVCYQGYGDFKDSWVAGNFDRAVIRYMGEPPWVSGDDE